jgi:hypothetical protein
LIASRWNDREIRIVGRKDVLEQAVLANGARCQGFAVLFANGAPAPYLNMVSKITSSLECGFGARNKEPFRLGLDEGTAQRVAVADQIDDVNFRLAID